MFPLNLILQFFPITEREVKVKEGDWPSVALIHSICFMGFQEELSTCSWDRLFLFLLFFLLLWFGGKLVCFMLVFIKFVYYKMFGFNFLFFRKGQGYLEDAQFKHVSCDVSLIFLYRAVWFCFPLFMVYMSSQTLERKTMRGSWEWCVETSASVF